MNSYNNEKSNINRDNLERLYQEINFTIDEKNNILDENLKKVSNFLVNIVNQHIINNKGKKTCNLEIEGINKKGELLRSVIIEANEVKNSNWIDSNWGFENQIFPNMQVKFEKLLRHLSSNVEKIEKYGQTGFKKIDNKYVYIHGDGIIGDTSKNLRLNNKIKNYKLIQDVSKERLANKISLNLLELINEEISYPLLSLVYLSPLVEILNEFGKVPSFAVWMYGETGSRKTSIAQVFLSHFGNFKNFLPATFNDTKTSLEVKANYVKDALFLVDDYKPAQTRKDKESQDEKAEEISRFYGDRISKGRSNVNLEIQKENDPKGMVLITGEGLISGHSSNARMIALELKRNMVDLNKLTKAQNDIEILSASMAGYIRWLLNYINNSQKSEKLKNLVENFEIYRKELQDKYKNAHGRTIEAISWLKIGFSMMLDYFSENGLINRFEVQDYITSSEEIFENIIKKQIEIIEISNPVDKFINILRELINSNSINICELINNTPSGYEKGNIVGYKDKNYYYFHDENLYQKILKICQGHSISFTMGKVAIWKQLKNNGILKVDGNNICVKKTIKINNETNRFRLLCIPRNKIDEI
ncbi:TPA: DUF927 domain-containing protein [Clostridioides difficile]|nr:DUF927 domain-containing protein [Clostridioides difficile]